MARVATRRRAVAPEPTVERRISFYQIDAGQKNGEPVTFDPLPVLEHIEGLPWTLEGRYLDVGEGNVAFVLPKARSYPQKLVYVISLLAPL